MPRRRRKKKKQLTKKKARTILHDKSVKGHPLTDKQRRFFGAVASGGYGSLRTAGKKKARKRKRR